MSQKKVKGVTDNEATAIIALYYFHLQGVSYITFKELQKATEIEFTSLRYCSTSLEEKGYISKEYTEGQGKPIRMRLTEKGKALGTILTNE